MARSRISTNMETTLDYIFGLILASINFMVVVSTSPGSTREIFIFVLIVILAPKKREKTTKDIYKKKYSRVLRVMVPGVATAIFLS